MTVRAIRTDIGVDLLFASEDLEAVRTAALEAGAVEVGAEAAECLRIEHGRPRYGLDLDDSVIPQEAGLNERAVSFTKGCYVGQETVARLFYRGKPNRELRGLSSAEPLPVGTELKLAERELSGRSRARPSRHATGRSRWRSFGARRRWARPCGRAASTRRSSCSCRFVDAPASD